MKSISYRLTHVLRCRDVTRLLSQLQDRPATLKERTFLRLHLSACKACRDFEQQIKLMEEGMRRYRR